jgi:hypothetical protein
MTLVMELGLLREFARPKLKRGPLTSLVNHQRGQSVASCSDTG